MKLLALSRDGGSPVSPTEANARSGAYPLVRRLWLASRPGRDTETVAQFLAFTASPEAARIIAAQGYLPIAPIP